jgi:flagellar hook-length control protein FliK
MIASAPTMSPSSGVEPAAAARHGGDRSAGSTRSARSFERTLNDARERSDAGPRRSHEGAPARSEKAHTAHRSPAAAGDATSDPADSSPTATGARSDPPAEAAEGTAPVADTAAGASAEAGVTALAAGAIAAAALPAVPTTAAGTTSGTTIGAATTSVTAPGAATGEPATGAAGPNVATGVGAAPAVDAAGSGAPTARVSLPGQPAAAASVTAGAPAGLTVTVETRDARGGVASPTGQSTSPMPDAGASTAGASTAAAEAAAAGAATAVTATTTGPSQPSTGSARTADPSQPLPAGQVTPAAPATSSAPTSPSAPHRSTGEPQWLQQAVQAQLTGRLVAAARGSDGSVQRLTLHLHPADLGAVQVVATLDDGTVSLQLLAGNPSTRDALRASLGVLRHDLAAAGLDGTRLDVSDQPPSQQGMAQQRSGGWSAGSSRSFAGPGAEGHAMAAGRSDLGPAPSPGGADVRSGRARNQGVDLRL